MTMRNLGIGIALLALAGVCLGASLLTTGQGWVGTASTTAVRVDSFAANKLSVKNTGSVRMFAGVNFDTTNLFNTATTSLTNSLATQAGSVPIEAGDTFTFDCVYRAQIDSFCVKTTNSTSTFVIGAF